MNRKQLVIALFAIALLMLLAARTWADGGVQGALVPDRPELTVGDPVRLALEVNHPAGYQVFIPKLEQVWGNLEVRGQSQATTEVLDDGTATTRQTIEVTLFSPGEFRTPELPLTISDGSGQLTESIIPAVSLNVVPTLAENDNELRDIKPQAGLQVPAVWPWFVGGGLVLLAVAAVAGWWAYRRWRGEPFLAPFVDNRPPWQVAHDELVRIGKLGLVEERRFKEYYTLVTDCLRTYLEDQFQLRVYDRTTSQLKPVLQQSHLAPEHTRRILDLFTWSDMVKFAKFAPEAAVAHQMLEEALALVDRTRPQKESDLESFMNEGNPPVAPVTKSRLSYQSGQ
jgi:hypothetical protein